MHDTRPIAWLIGTLDEGAKRVLVLPTFLYVYSRSMTGFSAYSIGRLGQKSMHNDYHHCGGG